MLKKSKKEHKLYLFDIISKDLRNKTKERKIKYDIYMLPKMYDLPEG